jgi:hypothetical protein
MGASNATFTYVKIAVVLMYFTNEGRINIFEGEIKPSDWLQLSEIQCAQTTASRPAAERIIASNPELWSFGSSSAAKRRFDKHN